MRRTLSAADAKNRLADALRQAENGDLVMITRYRKPVAPGGRRSAGAARERDSGAESSSSGSAADEAGVAAEPANEGGPPAVDVGAAEELRRRAAAASLRRIDYDLARLPEKLRPVLRLIRANLLRLASQEEKGVVTGDGAPITGRNGQRHR